MQINSKDLNLFQLLSIQSEQIIIPAYQRRYAWGYNQVAALFEDIDMLRENDGHLFGMLIVYTTLHTGGLNQVELVDGQQRLTTITLLLLAIKNKYESLGNTGKVDEIRRMIYCKGYDDVEKSKIILGELDEKDFQKILNNDVANIFNQNLSNAFNWFSEWVEDLYEKHKIEWLNKFYYKLVNVAKVIRLDVGMAKDAYKLFETINNRGLKLSPTDLLKNFILGHAAKIGEQKLNEVKDQWSTIIVSLDGIDTDIFFRQYITGVLTRKIPMSKLVSEFKKHYMKHVKQTDLLGEFVYYNDEPVGDDEDEIKQISTSDETELETKDQKVDVSHYLNEIINASACYKNIYFRKFPGVKINRHLKNLHDILAQPSYIFLMFYLQTNSSEKEKVDLLRLFETFMMRRHICASRTSENDDIFARLLRIKDDNYIESIKQALLEDMPDDEDFKESFPKNDFGGILIDRAKYALCQIEYHVTGNTGELTINTGNEVHLEHIIPEKIALISWKQKYGDWETYLGVNSISKHKKFVSKIGNMTLLAGDLNIKASNNPFTRKRDSYKKSAITITKELGEDYSDFKFYHVEKRGKELAEIASQIWKFN